RGAAARASVEQTGPAYARSQTCQGSRQSKFAPNRQRRHECGGGKRMVIHTIRNGVFRHDAELKREILSLLRPSYEDPSNLLEREFDHCETLYVARNGDDRLLAFFLVAWEPLDFKQETPQSVYLGLSATSEETKGSGIVRELYAQFRSDASAWEN